MSYITNLKCRECGQEYPISPLHVCETCFGPLEVTYDYARIRAAISRSIIEKRAHNLWRYRELLPVDFNENDVVGPNSGFTPLLHCKRLGAELGLKHLYIKDDTVNHPTLSYKDRVVSVSITKAREFGFTTVSCASHRQPGDGGRGARGARGTAMLHLHARRRGGGKGRRLDDLRRQGDHDSRQLRRRQPPVQRNRGQVRLGLRQYQPAPLSTPRARRPSASKIAEQLGWRLPDHMVVPTAGGTILPKVAKAFKELKEVGLIKSGEAKIHSAQAAGSAPVIHALHKGTDLITPVKPDTIAKSIAIGNPADGFYVLKAVRDSGGWGNVATDPEIIDAIKLLARTEGIFAEPAGGTTLAVAIKLIKQGRIDPDETVVVGITGNGYKTLEAVAGSIEQPSIIDARLKDFDVFFDQLTGKRAADSAA